MVLPRSSRRLGAVSLLVPTTHLHSLLPRPHLLARTIKASKASHAAQSRRLHITSLSPCRPTGTAAVAAGSSSCSPSARHISTETRTWIVDSVKGAARLTVYLWAGAFLAFVAWQGYEHDAQERLTPTPHEWSLITRYWMREAEKARTPSQAAGLEMPRWIDVVRSIQKTLERLEDPNGDGKELRPTLGEGEGDILVEGVGKAGYDLTACPESWRRGYFQALMMAGTAAEHTDGFVVDKTRDDQVFPPQVVLGPSNPNPTPMPFNSNLEAPREENCVPFFDQPHKYYMKVLTSIGFTNEQKLEAALAYADWLDFKGLPDSATDMHDWAMDIAEAAYIERGEQVPYDRKTGSLRRGSPTETVSTNLLRAINAAAEHLARSGDTKTALPAFLTTLRVIKGLPSEPLTHSRDMSNPNTISPSAPTLPDSSSSQSSTSSTSPLAFLSSFIHDAPYPPAPPSGDLPASRSSFSSCTEAAIQAHIGEILFVSLPENIPSSLLTASPPPSFRQNAVQANTSQLAGLAWTQQAVERAEKSLRRLSGRDDDTTLIAGQARAKGLTNPKKNAVTKNESAQDKERCREALNNCAQCLTVAVTNWQTMVGKLADQERALQVERARNRRGRPDDITPDLHPHKQTAPAATTSNSSRKTTGWTNWLWGSGSGMPSQDSSSQEVVDHDIGLWLDEARKVELRKFEIRKLLREEKLRVDF